MALLRVMTENGSHLLYDEVDVASVCKRMRCGHHAEDCRTLMKKKAMECVLCYAVLTALKKPCRIRVNKLGKEPKQLTGSSTKLKRS